MFNLGGYELVILLVLGLLIFGTRIPSVARSLGSAVVQFRKGLKGDEEPVGPPTKNDGKEP
jgi:sec-independent protein translocase protein TatA